LKSIQPKKPSKDQREKLVLLGLVELYLQHGKPIGSNTLRENGFEALSSATIRNYFSRLEESGYLKQQHSSGGRIPTNAAYKVYAETVKDTSIIDEKEKTQLLAAFSSETREVNTYLQKCAELLSEKSQTAVFLSSPRFDQDFILDVKMISIDNFRCLCVLVTDFGVIKTEVLFTDKKLSSFTLKRIEQYFQSKITGRDKPDLSKDEEAIASKFYSEVMLRHIVSYNHFSSIDILKTGFSKLLSYSDFTEDASGLASGLSFFENNDALRLMLSESCKAADVKCWIGEDLTPLSTSNASSSCAVMIFPYKINQTIAGAIGILGPSRLPYKQLFSLLKVTAEAVGNSLTKSLYKFKISFRQPTHPILQNLNQPFASKGSDGSFLIEDQTLEE
jgi:heat-inducible transcriptional repressor